MERRTEPLAQNHKKWTGPKRKYIVNHGYNLNHNQHIPGDVVELPEDEAEAIMAFEPIISPFVEEKSKGSDKRAG